MACPVLAQNQVEIGRQPPNTRNMAAHPDMAVARVGFGLAGLGLLASASTSFAQSSKGGLSFLEVPDPIPLPGPSMGTRLLFENPLPVTLVLLVAGLVLYVVLNARGRFKQGLALAGACVLVAGGLWILAALVQTEHEKMRGAARDLVDAVATVDLAQMDELLAPEARLSSVPTLGDMGKAAIIEAVGGNLGPGRVFEIDEYAIQEMQTALDGPSSGRVQLRMRVDVKQMGYPNVSWWALGLSLGPDGNWRVVSIRALAIRGVS
jgi:hypothetical protein